MSAGLSVPVVTLNTLGWTRTTYLHLVVPIPDVEVVGSDGTVLPSQVNANDAGTYDLFVSVTMPAVGYSTVTVRPSQQVRTVYRAQAAATLALEAIENEWLALQFDNVTNLFTALTNKVRPPFYFGPLAHTGPHAGQRTLTRPGWTVRRFASRRCSQASQLSTQLSQQYYAYASVTSGQPSGAYIFSPTGAATPLVDATGVTLEVIDGPPPPPPAPPRRKRGRTVAGRRVCVAFQQR